MSARSIAARLPAQRPDLGRVLLAASALAASALAAACTQAVAYACDQDHPCPDGWVCDDAGTCVEPEPPPPPPPGPCTSSDACADDAAPYCTGAKPAEMACTATCDDDAVCAEVDASAGYCNAGACAACGLDDDRGCGGTAPVCDDATGAATCRACATDDECASGVCLADGSCADEARVSYVVPAPAPDATCASDAPCGLEAAALAVDGDPAHARPIIKLLPTPGASFELAATLKLADGTRLEGSGAVIELLDLGAENADVPVLAAVGAVDLRRLTVRGAHGADPLAAGILGTEDSTLSLREVTVRDNDQRGLWLLGAAAIVDSTITDNRFGGIAAEGDLIIERSIVSGNTGAGRAITCSASAPLTMRDSVVAGNDGAGVVTFAATTISGSRIEANLGAGVRASAPLTLLRSTVRDNLLGGVRAVAAEVVVTIVNNVIAGNGSNLPDVAFGGLAVDAAPGSMVAFNTIAENHSGAGAGATGGLSCLGGSLTTRNNLLYANRTGASQAGQRVGSCGSDHDLIATSSDAPQLAFVDAAAGDYHLTDGSVLALDLGVALGDGEVGLDVDGEARSAGGTPDLGADELVD
jgi:hypothetical protein